jgi:apolipoprotein N-acyltransferase
MESIVPFMIWALFCFPVGYLTPNFIKDQTWQIKLVVLLPIFGSFFIGASFYIIFESSGPSFKLFDFYGYFIYSMMFLYYGLLAGVPSSCNRVFVQDYHSAKKKKHSGILIRQ